jgi:nucleoside-diphosphate-sugar epimerase
MKIFLAGATGALGKRLVPIMIAAGHQVVGMTKTPGKIGELTEAGAQPVVADALDPQAVMKAVMRARPHVVIHQMTSLAKMRDLKHFDKELESTNRLRTEGTEYLLAAAQAAGATRFIAQSFTGWPNSRTGGRVKSEEDPLDANPPEGMRRTLAAIQSLEEMVLGAPGLSGVVLRYGSFYGPGTSIVQGGEIIEMVRARRLPVFGDGAGIWSFLHIDDAASATSLAIERGPSGKYNVVDDEPAEVSTWLPYLATAIGAKPPHHLPAWLGRLVIGETGLSMMTSIRGSSNALAKRAFGWRPIYASWRDGFRRGLSAASSKAA